MIPAHTFLDLDADRITPEAEEEFFTSLRMRNGTYKTTFWKRFSEIDQTLARLVRAGGLHVDNVLDVGVSSGVSTLELCEALVAADHPVRIVATDLMTEARLVRVFPRCFTLTDETGYPLRHDVFAWTLKPWVVGNDYRSGFFVVRKCINLAFTSQARRLLRRSGSPAVRRVELVTPRLRPCQNISVQNDDITRFNLEFAGRFDFIRAANILNKGYFTDDQLKSSVALLGRYLVDRDGHLLVVRTHQDGTNHGTLFAIAGRGQCVALQRFGEGSEIEDLVLGALQTRQPTGVPETP
ncbi:MAG: ATP/GTP-binding protein [Acidimicrobiales bacterium]